MAVLLVLLFHSAVAPWTKGMFVGVDVFFVLSGFLITWLLIAEHQRFGHINLPRFYARRILRLYPALLAMLAVTTFAVVQFYSDVVSSPLRGDLIVMSYSANWYGVANDTFSALGPLNHTWSLSAEEQFYLVWPFILVALLARRVRLEWVAIGLGVCLAIEPLWRAVCLNWLHAGFPRLYFGLDTHADGLLAGCLLGVIASSELWRHVTRLNRILPLLGLAGVLALGWVATSLSLGDTLQSPWVLTLCAVATGAVIVSVLAHPSRLLVLLLGLPPLTWVGRISYGLYVWHFPIFYVLVIDSSPHRTVLQWSLSFLAAIISYFVVERPALELKRRFDAGARRVVPVPIPVPSPSAISG